MKTRTMTELREVQDRQARDTVDQETERVIEKVDTWSPVGGGSGGGTRWAFCKTAAGSGKTIVAFLDKDTTGTEITVYCEIAPSSVTDLDEAVPRLYDGLRIEVKYDSLSGLWRYAGGVFIGSETCT